MFPPDVLDHIARQAFPKRCAVCESDAFQVQTEALCMQMEPERDRQQRLAPLVAVACQKCGHLHLFLPDKLGLSAEIVHLIRTIGFKGS